MSDDIHDDMINLADPSEYEDLNCQCLRTFVAELNPLEDPIFGRCNNAFRCVEQVKPLKATSAALSGCGLSHSLKQASA